MKTTKSIYLAIVTKYHGPTNTRGSRITAKWGSTRLTLPRDYSVDSEIDHERAAAAIINKAWKNETAEIKLFGSRINPDAMAWSVIHVK